MLAKIRSKAPWKIAVLWRLRQPQEILIESVWMHRLDGDFRGELSISLEISTIA
jgi:hypothetical protein